MKTLNTYLCAALLSFAISSTTAATPIANARLLEPNPSFQHLPAGQHYVDVRSGLLGDNGLLRSEVNKESYYGIGILPEEVRGASIDDGLTVLLSFAMPSHMAGLVISDLYARSLQHPLSTVAPGVQGARVTAFSNNNEVVFDSIIKGSRNGYVLVDFGVLLSNIDRLTISTGGGISGLVASDIGIAAFIVHIPEPFTWALMLVGLSLIFGFRKKLHLIKK